MGRLVSQFLRHVIPGVVRPLHVLWNEIIGFLFLVFTVVAIFYVIRAVRSFDGEIEGLMRIVMPGGFGLLMAYFGFSSFRKARKISRS